MKKHVGLLISVLAIFCGPVSFAQTQEENLDDLKIKEERLKRDLRDLELTINKAFFEEYFLFAEETQHIIPIYGHKFDKDKLLEDKPELSQLRKNYDEANGRLMKILDKDKHYIKAKQERDQAVSKEEKDQAQKKVNEAFQRLRYSSPEYVAARDEQQKALYESNIATARYLLEEAQSQGKELPLTIIPQDKIIKIRERSSEIREMESIKYKMQILLGQIQSKILKLTYDA